MHFNSTALILFLFVSLFVFACKDQGKDPNYSPMVNIFSPERIVAEKGSFINADDDEEDMIRVSYKDSAFYTAISRVSVFRVATKKEIAEYVLSHLKGVKTLRLLDITHYYQITEKRSSYFITYYKNENTDRKWGCRLNYAKGRYRLQTQNIHPDKLKGFQRMMSMKPLPEDLKGF
ncbi:MAG: hypothetical protein IPI46_00415 [Bacteroidetes bacterium]|nr:hypothetical protein [Bacteroidota bacterium]